MKEPLDLSASRLFQLNVPVRDIERAVAFYRDALGLPIRARRDNLAFFSAGATRILVEPISEEGGRYGHPGSILYFEVVDIHATYAELLRRGVSFIEAPARTGAPSNGVETWMAFFEDSDWNTHAIVAQVPVSASDS